MYSPVLFLLPQGEAGSCGFLSDHVGLCWEEGLWQAGATDVPTRSSAVGFALALGTGASQLIFGFLAGGIGLYIVELVCTLWGRGEKGLDLLAYTRSTYKKFLL